MSDDRDVRDRPARIRSCCSSNVRLHELERERDREEGKEDPLGGQQHRWVRSRKSQSSRSRIRVNAIEIRGGDE